MGPQGMAEIGQGIMARTRYAMEAINKIPSLELPFFQAPHFNEFVVDFSATGLTIGEVNRSLRERGIFGGFDLKRNFPEMGERALYCISEVHNKADIDSLVSYLKEIVGQ
jgi:glycine dehydrogenase subunit 1